MAQRATQNALLRRETHEKRPPLPCWWREHVSERLRSEERHRPEVCTNPLLHPRAVLRALAPAVASKTGLGGRFDTSRTPLRPAALAGCGSSALMGRRRRSLTWCWGQARRSDPCSRYQHGSGDRVLCFSDANRVAASSDGSVAQTSPAGPCCATTAGSGAGNDVYRSCQRC